MSMAARVRTWGMGNPMKQRQTIAREVIIRTMGWLVNWWMTSSLRLFSEADRVTIIPVATEISRAGTWDISPSPTVAVE